MRMISQLPLIFLYNFFCEGIDCRFNRFFQVLNVFTERFMYGRMDIMIVWKRNIKDRRIPCIEDT